MTREEAINLLVNATYSDEWQGNEDLATANLMAIRSLKAWDKVWKYILNHEDIWETDEILEVLDKHLKEVKE